MVIITCPYCGTEIKLAEAPRLPFTCPQCGMNVLPEEVLVRKEE